MVYIHASNTIAYSADSPGFGLTINNKALKVARMEFCLFRKLLYHRPDGFIGLAWRLDWDTWMLGFAHGMV
jgi:hypothetical protein